jgi:hypothetical protein
VQIRFTTASRKHGIGKSSALHVMATVTPDRTTTPQGNPAWLYVGPDELGRELEVIAVETDDKKTGDRCLLVIHVMPVSFRKGGTDA